MLYINVLAMNGRIWVAFKVAESGSPGLESVALDLVVPGDRGVPPAHRRNQCRMYTPFSSYIQRVLLVVNTDNI